MRCWPIRQLDEISSLFSSDILDGRVRGRKKINEWATRAGHQDVGAIQARIQQRKEQGEEEHTAGGRGMESGRDLEERSRLKGDNIDLQLLHSLKPS